MAQRRNVLNPFFVLLGVVGAVFAISAVVYGVMSLQSFHAAGDWAKQAPPRPLLLFFREHGTMVLAIELAVLGILTVAAIWTDDYWIRRARNRSSADGRRV